MQIARTVGIAALAFIAGALAVRTMPPAIAQGAPAAPLTAQIIDTSLLEGEAIGPIAPNTALRSKLLATTEHGAVLVQQGDIGKHTHMGTDEIQYIVAGTGTVWLGDTQRQIKPGDLIVIPRGTVHAGTVATSGKFKAIVIKLPPQAPGDTHFVQ